MAFGVQPSPAKATSGAPAPPSTQSAQQFGASVELVRVSVGVYARSGPVPKLEIDDFRVYDNGELQPIRFFLEPVDTPLIIALVIDASGSMDVAWADVVRATRQFLGSLQPRDCVFVLPFSSRYGPGRWGRGDDDWETFLGGVRPGGGTPLHGALLFALETLLANANVQTTTDPLYYELETDPRVELPPPRLSLQAEADRAVRRVTRERPRPVADGCRPREQRNGAAEIGVDARRAVVALSDGRSGDTATLDRVVAMSRRGAMPVFAVILGNAGASGSSQMARIARETGALGVEARGAQHLFGAFDAVMGFLDDTYVLAYSLPAGAAAGEERELRVELPGHPRLRPLFTRTYIR